MKKAIFVLIGLVMHANICFAATDRVFETDAKNTLNTLIDFYKNKDSANFMALVSLDFSDSRGYTCAELAASLKYDFCSFDNINLYITGIKEQIISKDSSRITIIAGWNRAMTISSTAQIWMLRGTTSFTFVKEKDSNIKLKEITGDLFFGLADPNGIIVLSSGTLDGQQITVPVLVKEGKII